MLNELLFIVSILLAFSAVLFFYRFYGKTGLSCWICLASVIANLIVTKNVDYFGFTATLGNVLFGSVFLAADILSEQYGKKEADRGVLLGLFANIAFIIISQIVLFYKPSSMDLSKDGFNLVFRLTPRVCIGSVCAYAFGNFLDIVIFNRFKKIHGDRHLWLRNNISTITAQLLDNFVLHIIAFLGILSFKGIIKLSLNVWIIEIVVALCDTPFLYFAKNKITKPD